MHTYTRILSIGVWCRKNFIVTTFSVHTKCDLKFVLDHLAQYWKLLFDRFLLLLFLNSNIFFPTFYWRTGHLVNSIFTSFGHFYSIKFNFRVRRNEQTKTAKIKCASHNNFFSHFVFVWLALFKYVFLGIFGRANKLNYIVNDPIEWILFDGRIHKTN